MLKFADPVLCNAVRYGLTTVATFLAVILVSVNGGTIGHLFFASVIAAIVHYNLTIDLFEKKCRK